MESFFVPCPPIPDSGDEGMLCYYDGPLMYLTHIGDVQNRVFVVRIFGNPSQDPCLVAEITDSQEQRLLASTVTLRALCLECLPPNGLGVYHVPDSNDLVWELRPLLSIEEDWLPGDVVLEPPEVDTDTP